MKKYIVTVLLEAFVEADSATDAIENAPKLPEIEGWRPVSTDPYDVCAL